MNHQSNNNEDIQLELKDIQVYAKKLYEKVFVTGMVHGNYSDAKAIESTKLLLDSLGSKPLPEEERYEQVVKSLPKSFRFSREVEDNNNSLAYAIQIAGKGWKQACKDNKELKLGLNVVKGEICYKAVSEAFDLPYTNVDTFLD